MRTARSIFQIEPPTIKEPCFLSMREVTGATDMHSMRVFGDEFVVLGTGSAGQPNAAIAAALVADTAKWAYEVIRQHPRYWIDKQFLIRRMVRTINLTLWQKRRETGYESGVIARMVFVIVTKGHYFVCSVGNNGVLQYRNGKVTRLIVDTPEQVTPAMGMQRLGVIPRLARGPMHEQDILLVVPNESIAIAEQALLALPLKHTHARDSSLSLTTLSQAVTSNVGFSLPMCLYVKLA